MRRDWEDPTTGDRFVWTDSWSGQCEACGGEAVRRLLLTVDRWGGRASLATEVVWCEVCDR